MNKKEEKRVIYTISFDELKAKFGIKDEIWNVSYDLNADDGIDSIIIESISEE